MKVMRKVIEIDEKLCNGCGVCIEACSEGAIMIGDGKARLVAEKYCDGLGACLGECPQGAIRILEREAEEFDPDAVMEYMRLTSVDEGGAGSRMECGCSSAYVQSFASPDSGCCAQETAERPRVLSALTHWPVQIRLVPATAPFLKNARILVASDCSTVAIANFHEDFLKGRVVMIGCPKFDDVNPYIQKFAEIFKANAIEDITAVVMEVPCCQGLPRIIKKGMELADKEIPLEQVIISTKGEVLTRGRV